MADWVDDLDALDHRERMRRLVVMGTSAAHGDTRARGRIEAAGKDASSYARSLALATAYGSRDAEHVERALRDASRTVRRRAEKWVPKLCSDEQAARALSSAPAGKAQTRLAQRLARRGRTAPIDALIDGAAGDRRVVDLLGYASPQCVARALPTAAESLSPDGWRRLARRHGDVASQWLLARLDNLAPRLRWQLGWQLPALARSNPTATLPLVERLLTTGDEPKHWLSAVLTELVRREPTATFDLLRRLHQSLRPMPPPGPFGAVRFDRVAHRLGPERLQYLVAHAASTLSDGVKARRWFLRLSESERKLVVETWLAQGRGSWGGFLLRHVDLESTQGDRAYRRWSAAAQDQHGVIAHEQVQALPRALREREGRRHLTQVEWLETRLAERLAYARYLPFAEAKEAVAAWLGHPEGEVRSVALSALVSTAQLSPETTADVLELIGQRRFEQDPVRQAMLSALSQLPVRCFCAELLPRVATVIEHGLDAADLSFGTSAAIERLAVRLFRVDPVWGAEQLTRVMKVRGIPSTFGLVEGLVPSEVRALSPALEKLAESWTHRERAGAVIWLARSLGGRLPLVPPLLEALERLASEQPFVAVAAHALDLLRTHTPTRFAELVPNLLKADKSFIALSSVATFVSTRRQDLLDEFLTAKKITGRFASSRSHWVLSFGTGHGLWNARQHRMHADALAKLAADRDLDVPTLRSVLMELSCLAWAPAEALIGFASDPRQPVREIAVRALPRIDDGSGLGVLVECLGDDRARWAIYALRGELRELSSEQVVLRLSAAPMNKVTVAKEVVRLMGELGGAAGYEWLVRLEPGELHRDVFIALLRALWDHLGREETWSRFEAALQSPDWVVATKLADVPLRQLSQEEQRRVTALLVRLLQRPERDARLDLLRRAAYLPLDDTERALFGACLSHLSTDNVQEAVEALRVVLTRLRPDEEKAVAQAIASLRSRRRSIDALLQALPGYLGPYAPAPVLGVAKAVLRAIASDPFLAPHRITLAGPVLSWKELAQLLAEIAEQGLLHYDSMRAAAKVVSKSVHPDLLERDLGSRPDPRLRRLGLEALRAAAKPKRGWSDERRERLAHYQADADPLVSGAAAFVFPPAEGPKAETE